MSYKVKSANQRDKNGKLFRKFSCSVFLLSSIASSEKGIRVRKRYTESGNQTGLDLNKQHSNQRNLEKDEFSASFSNSLQNDIIYDIGIKRLNQKLQMFRRFFANDDDCERSHTGGKCRKDSDCLSDVCRSGVCFATEQCQVLKHDGKTFDENRINIVFVASGFESLDDWEKQVQESYSVFPQYNMFSSSNDRINVFYVYETSSEYCSFGCSGIDRLLCCDILTAQSFADKCFPSGMRQQTIVVHNDNAYGGAGYLTSNMATISTNIDAPKVAIHELGHSLFALVDEYSYGNGKPTGPNCDTNGCKKWDDLFGRQIIEERYGKSPSCISGCQNNAHFIGEMSFMDDIHFPVGAVNERYTCCTFLLLTGDFPSYCNIFNFELHALKNFCDLDHQKYNDPSNLESLSYVSLLNPYQISIQLNDDIPVISDMEPLSPGMFSLNKVQGDFNNLAIAKKMAIERYLQVTITYINGMTKVLMFQTKSAVDVPPKQNLPTGIIEKMEDIINENRNLEKITVDIDWIQVIFEDRHLIRNIHAEYENI